MWFRCFDKASFEAGIGWQIKHEEQFDGGGGFIRRAQVVTNQARLLLLSFTESQCHGPESIIIFS